MLLISQALSQRIELGQPLMLFDLEGCVFAQSRAFKIGDCPSVGFGLVKGYRSAVECA